MEPEAVLSSFHVNSVPVLILSCLHCGLWSICLTLTLYIWLGWGSAHMAWMHGWAWKPAIVIQAMDSCPPLLDQGSMVWSGITGMHVMQLLAHVCNPIILHSPRPSRLVRMVPIFKLNILEPRYQHQSFPDGWNIPFLVQCTWPCSSTKDIIRTRL